MCLACIYIYIYDVLCVCVCVCVCINVIVQELNVFSRVYDYLSSETNTDKITGDVGESFFNYFIIMLRVC